MPNINWEMETSKPAGIYRAEVSESVEMSGRDSGQPYFFLTFKDIADQVKICHDVVSFSPNAMNMTIAKLKALGFDKSKVNIEADELIGRRVWIATKIEHQDGYEPRLAVDIGAKGGFRCGYKSEADGGKETVTITPEPSPPWPAPLSNALDDDIPF